MKHIAILSVLVFVLGCAAIDAKRLEKDIANYTQTVETICTTAELFSTVGKDVPGVEQCRKALQTAELIQGYGDTLAITDTLRCVEKNNVKSVEFVQCLSTVKWWPVLADRVVREASRAIE